MDWLDAVWRAIGSAWSYFWDFITGIPWFFFGSTLESGWGIIFTIYTTAVFFGLIITGFVITWELLRAAEVGFNKEWVEQYNDKLPAEERHEINWTLARQQRVRSLCFILPLGAGVLASIYFWVGHSFTGVTYATFAAIWFGVGLILLRRWWVATVVWTARATPREWDMMYKYAGNMTARGAFGHYMNWGLQSRTSKRRRMFVRFLAMLNKVVSFLHLDWLKLRLLWPLTWWFFVGVTWPFGMVIALIKMGYDFTRKDDPLLMPAWSKSDGDKNEPRYTGKSWTAKVKNSRAAEVPSEA